MVDKKQSLEDGSYNLRSSRSNAKSKWRSSGTNPRASKRARVSSCASHVDKA